jgi:hypothetical protein
MSEGEGLRKEILSKTHHSSYTMQPGSTKMYKDEKRAKLDFSAKGRMVSQSGLTRFGGHVMGLRVGPQR